MTRDTHILGNPHICTLLWYDPFPAIVQYFLGAPVRAAKQSAVKKPVVSGLMPRGERTVADAWIQKVEDFTEEKVGINGINDGKVVDWCKVVPHT